MSSSSESDVISKELQNLDLIYYNVNLMTDVFKVIVIVGKLSPKSSNVAICRLVGTELYVRLDEYDLYRFEKTITLSCCFTY